MVNTSGGSDDHRPMWYMGAAGQIAAMPAFYQKPESMDDLVNFVVGKLLDQLGVEHSLFTRWGKM